MLISISHWIAGASNSGNQPKPTMGTKKRRKSLNQKDNTLPPELRAFIEKQEPSSTQLWADSIVKDMEASLSTAARLRFQGQTSQNLAACIQAEMSAPSAPDEVSYIPIQSGMYEAVGDNFGGYNLCVVDQDAAEAESLNQ